MLMRLCSIFCGIAVMLLAAGDDRVSTATDRKSAVEFATPEMILDGSEYACHPHPHYADFDGDGKIDQLLGVWDRLLVFRNLGTNAAPNYATPTYFDAAEPTAHLPAG